MVSASSALAGGETSGGGDGYAAHFAGIGGRLDVVYRNLCQVPSPATASLCRVRPSFSRAVSTARVLPRDSVLGADGQPREAGPSGTGDILLNVPLYKARLTEAGSAERIVPLAAHEYMMIAGAETDDDYTTSARLLVALRSQFIDLAALLGELPDEVGTVTIRNPQYEGQVFLALQGIERRYVSVSRESEIQNYRAQTVCTALGYGEVLFSATSRQDHFASAMADDGSGHMTSVTGTGHEFCSIGSKSHCGPVIAYWTSFSAVTCKRQ